MRCLLAGSWPSARHDQAQWLGTDKARAARGRKKEALGCHALLLQVRGDWAWYKALFGFKGWASKEICWRCKANCSDIPWTDTSTAAAWRTSRYRTSELLARQTEQGISVNPLFSLPGFFGRAHLHRCVALDGPGHDAGRDRKFIFRSGRRLGRHTICFLFPVCVSALVCLCVCSSVPCVHVQLCFVSPAGPGLFRAQSRSGRIAELWNRIKLHYKTFHTQSRLQKLTWEMIRVDQKPPKLRAKGAETSHLVPCCFELAMDFHKHQRSAHSLTVCGLFEQLFGLYMTMSMEPFDSAACARCSRQFCTLYKALSKEASDDNLWKLKPKMHMVQEMCEVQSELLGNPREFWTYRDESFMGVVSSMAHSRGGSATASTIPLRVLDTHRALSL